MIKLTEVVHDRLSVEVFRGWLAQFLRRCERAEWIDAGGAFERLITDLAVLATRIGAAMQIPVMLGAIALVHWGRWNFVPTDDFPMGGMQFQVTLALVALYLVITGNGLHHRVSSAA